MEKNPKRKSRKDNLVNVVFHADKGRKVVAISVDPVKMRKVDEKIYKILWEDVMRALKI